MSKTEIARTLWVPGRPMVKQRPLGLGLTKSGRPHYVKRDPSGWEDTVAKTWLSENGRTLMQGPLALQLAFYTDGVAILVARRSEAYRMGRGDLSNLVKAVEDGLNGIAWIDDHQIVSLSAWSLQSKKTTTADLRTPICATCSDIDSDLQAAGDVSHCKICERALAKRGLS